MIAHSIGYVGEVSENQLAVERRRRCSEGISSARAAVERTYDDPLRGHRGWMVVSVNSVGRQIGDARVLEDPDHGSAAAGDPGSATAARVARGPGRRIRSGQSFIDVRTGDVLAMVSTPSFDPNLFADGISHETWEAITEDPRRPLHDRVIASFYAPGSTFKVVMAVAGLGDRHHHSGPPANSATARP